MLIRIVLGFLLFWALVYGHYQWSESTLHPTLGNIDFNADDALVARIGPLPFDRYRVVFGFPANDRTGERNRKLIVSELQEGRIGIEIRVTGFFGRDVLAYSGSRISMTNDWRYSSRHNHLWGPTQFTVLPLERYRVSARLSGENAFLEEREILLALSADRDTGYHSLIYILLFWLSGALFVVVAVVWIVFKVVTFVQRRRRRDVKAASHLRRG